MALLSLTLAVVGLVLMGLFIRGTPQDQRPAKRDGRGQK